MSRKNNSNPGGERAVVRHYESRRYFVQSKPGGREHLVDLDEWKGRGECGCEDFEFRTAPEYKAGNDADLSCKHIRAARQFELDNPILTEIAAIRPELTEITPL